MALPKVKSHLRLDRNILNRFKQALLNRQRGLTSWLNQDSSETTACIREHCADPMKEFKDVNNAIDLAIAQIEEDTFGDCTLCSEAVEVERLQLDFTTSVCLAHYSPKEVEALERDLELAARFQQHLLPCCVPELEHLQIAAHLKPAGIVSGDYFDFFPYKETGQGILIADIMGKGLPASMLMANFQATLRALGPEHENVGQLVTRLNTLFRFHISMGLFISMVALTYDPESHAIQYSNAGHLPPLLWRAQSNTVDWLRPTGPAIGLMNAPTFQSESINMEPGDVLILYTDGLIEARNPAGEEFEQSRLASFVEAYHKRPAVDILDALCKTLTSFTQGEQRDDLSLLVVKKT